MPFKRDLMKWYIGEMETAEAMQSLPAMRPFAENTIAFLSELSSALMKTGREYSDVVTFAFWCRKAVVLSYRKGYAGIENRLGRGIVFHSTPSNVPVNFAFSFVSGLLAGNANIVRLPAKDFPQVDVICAAIKATLKNHPALAPYVCMMKYEPDKDVSDYFSAVCDTRVIWGGDATIAELRQSPLKPRANEICFADRYSICLIDADAYLQAGDKPALAQGFYNDTYFSDQNACTSPRIVIWRGNEVQAAKTVFWNELQRLVDEKYDLSPVQAVGKYASFCKLAASQPGGRMVKAGADNAITRVEVPELTAGLMDYKDNSGFFMEYTIQNIEEILPLCATGCQTLAYYGIEPQELREIVLSAGPRGIDRIVPIGSTMDFSLTWDGVDLIYAMSRVVGG